MIDRTATRPTAQTAFRAKQNGTTQTAFRAIEKRIARAWLGAGTPAASDHKSDLGDGIEVAVQRSIVVLGFMLRSPITILATVSVSLSGHGSSILEPIISGWVSSTTGTRTRSWTPGSEVSKRKGRRALSERSSSVRRWRTFLPLREKITDTSESLKEKTKPMDLDMPIIYG